MKKYYVTLLVLLVSIQANALIELRAGYGIQAEPSTDYAASSANALAGFNLDAIVKLPLLPVGLGLRYEKMGFEISSQNPAATGTFETDSERISAIINYRFIDFLTYLGVITTIGLSNTMEVNMSPYFSSPQKYESDFTFSAGLEGGVSLGLIQVGAEAGLFWGQYDRVSNGTDKIDMNGYYAKALVGVGF